jgi:hypothetical protein
LSAQASIDAKTLAGDVAGRAREQEGRDAQRCRRTLS